MSINNGNIPTETTLYSEKNCRCCGKQKLHWLFKRGDWRLYEEDGSLHDCPVSPLEKPCCCKRCGVDVISKRESGTFKYFDKNGKKHICKDLKEKRKKFVDSRNKKW